MATCYSAAWEAKVVTSAWWVASDQVSKTAPTGEYLTTGSFMIRGKKNFLPPSQLVMGFGMLFRLGDEESILRHTGSTDQVEFESMALPASADNQFTIDDHSDAAQNVKNGGQVQSDHDSDSIDEIDQPNNWSDAKGSVELDSAEPKDESTNEVHETEQVLDSSGHLAGPSNSDEEEFPDVQITLPNFVDAAQRSKSGDAAKEDEETPEKSEYPGGPPKRGQKYKRKKMKQKYKDQDEDERRLRLEILGSQGTQKEGKRKGKKGDKDKQHQQTTKGTRMTKEEFIKKTLEGSLKSQDSKDAPIQDQDQIPDHGDEDLADQENRIKGETTSALDSLTAQPLAEDTLLFAIPVCAPYTALNNYKHKVKLTPGSDKKGASIKTALSIFLRDRDLPSLERDIIKSLEGLDLTRNLPGRVKLSAPHLTEIHAKKSRKK